jgi:hypothetical protein
MTLGWKANTEIAKVRERFDAFGIDYSGRNPEGAILPVIRTWAQLAGRDVWEGTKDVGTSTGRTVGDGGGDFSNLDVEIPSSDVTYPVLDANDSDAASPYSTLKTYIDTLQADLDTFITAFPSYAEVISGAPSSPPDITESDAPTYQVPQTIDPPVIDVPVWDEDRAWSGGDEAMDAASTALAVGAFTYSESEFQSHLLNDSGVNVLYEIIRGDLESDNFGLDQYVEDRIFERAREREARLGGLAMDEALRTFSLGGFTAPTGVATAAVARARVEMLDKIASANRELTVKRADQLLEAKKAAIANGIALEEQSLRQHNAVLDRTLKRVTDEIEATIKIAGHNLSRIKMFVDKYIAFAQAFEARTKASISNVELFKARIDGENVKATVNKTLIEGWAAKLKAIADLYVARVQGFSSEIDGRVRYHAALADSYKAKAGATESLIGGVRSALELSDKREGNQINFSLTKYNGDIARAKVMLENTIGAVNTWAEEYKTKLQSITSLAVSALAALNVNLGLSYGASTSLSDGSQESESTSTSTNNNYDKTKGTPGGKEQSESWIYNYSRT